MCETDVLERGVQFLRSLARRPAELECREGPLELGKIRHIGALISARLRYEREFTSRDRFGHDLPELADLMVEVAGTDVESLVVDELQWRLEYCLERAGHILDVDNGTPGRTITVDHHLSGGEGTPHEIVENRVVAHARRETVDRPIAAKRRREAVVGKLPQRHFHLGFGAGVFGLWRKRSILVHYSRFRHAVHDARRGEKEARDPSLLC